MRRVHVLSGHLCAATESEQPDDQARWIQAIKTYSQGVKRLQTHQELPSMTLYELNLSLPPGLVFGDACEQATI